MDKDPEDEAEEVEEAPAAETDPLGVFLSTENLRRLAGSRAQELGRQHLVAGRIRALAVEETCARGLVAAGSDYAVELRVEAGELVSSCPCAEAEGGRFCKHAVAVALAWAMAREGGPPISTIPGHPGPPLGAVRDLLARERPDGLVERLLERADEDPELRRRLLLEVARRREGGPDLGAFREAVDEATHTHRYLRPGESEAFVEGVREVLDAVEALLEDGHGAAVIDLVERALPRIEVAFDEMDDSGDDLGEQHRRVQELHLRACRLARPDPIALAGRLFGFQLRSAWNVFPEAVADYRDVLGPAGLAAYRRLAQEAWEELPALGPGQRDPAPSGRRHVLGRILEALAKETGDVDAEAQLLQRDLSLPGAFLDLAALYAAVCKKTPPASDGDCVDVRGRSRGREEAPGWALETRS